MYFGLLNIMDTNTTTTRTFTDALSTVSQTEWIVIVVVLVLILVVMIIALAKCINIDRSNKAKSLLQDGQSYRSETVRSTATRSVAKSSTNMRKLPLNAEITRFSAGRVSRSAEYGVVIKDIRKTVQGEELPSNPPTYEQSDTLRTYQDTLPAVHRGNLSTPRDGNMMNSQHQSGNVRIVDQSGAILTNNQYVNHSYAPANSKAVFAAPDELYAKPCKPARMTTLQQPQQTIDLRYPILMM